MNDLVRTLERMCDQDDPQDRKLLLLAELVETKCEALGKNQEELKLSLDKTNDKLDRLTLILERYEQDKDDCPVYKNKSDFERLTVLLKYPRMSLLVLLGGFSLLVGMFSSSFNDLLKFIFGL